MDPLDICSLTFDIKKAPVIFTKPKARIKLSDDEVLSNLMAVKTCYEDELLPAMQKIASCFYEHLARASQIETVHAAWKNELVALEKRLVETQAKAKSYRRFIPAMHDGVKLRQAVAMQLYFMKTVAFDEPLITLISSRNHQQALGCYKAAVKTLDLSKLSLELDLVAKDDVIIQAVNALYSEAKRFIACDPAVQTVVTPLDIIMPTDRYFRCGMIGAKYLYKDVWNEVEALQNSAKLLFTLECSLQARIQAVLNGQNEPLQDFSHFEAECKSYHQRIAAIEQELQISSKSHAVWYYHAKVSMQLAHAKTVLATFEDLVVGKHAYLLKALAKAMAFFEVASTHENEELETVAWLKPLVLLVEALYSLDSLDWHATRFYKKAYKLIYSSLAQKGAALLKPSPSDARLADEEELQCYILKNLIRLVRFDVESKDPEFSKNLAAIECDPEHNSILEALLSTNSKIRQLYNEYIKSRT